jgi:hypothetical protein
MMTTSKKEQKKKRKTTSTEMARRKTAQGSGLRWGVKKRRGSKQHEKHDLAVARFQPTQNLHMKKEGGAHLACTRRRRARTAPGNEEERKTCS